MTDGWTPFVLMLIFQNVTATLTGPSVLVNHFVSLHETTSGVKITQLREESFVGSSRMSQMLISRDNSGMSSSSHPPTRPPMYTWNHSRTTHVLIQKELQALEYLPREAPGQDVSLE